MDHVTRNRIQCSTYKEAQSYRSFFALRHVPASRRAESGVLFFRQRVFGEVRTLRKKEKTFFMAALEVWRKIEMSAPIDWTHLSRSAARK